MLTLNKYNKDIKEFQKIIEEREDEQTLHKFLEKRVYFFNGIIRLFGCSPLYSKPQFGNNFVADFACFDSGSFGPEWRLIEIESPKHNLFTKNGDFSSEANHAIRQVTDWQHWISENISYAQKTFPHIQYPICYIFIGRRSEINEERAKRLKRFSYQNRMNFEIKTLDYLLSMARSVENLIDQSKDNKIEFSIPINALSGKELKQGLTEQANDYMKSFFSSQRSNIV